MRRVVSSFITCCLALAAACSKPESLPPALDQLISVGAGRASSISAEDAGAVVRGKHLLIWASGEWLVTALRAGNVGWPERGADAALLKVIEAGSRPSYEVCADALYEAVASDRLGAAVILLTEASACINDAAIVRARQLADSRGYEAMKKLLSTARTTQPPSSS